MLLSYLFVCVTHFARARVVLCVIHSLLRWPFYYLVHSMLRRIMRLITSLCVYTLYVWTCYKISLVRRLPIKKTSQKVFIVLSFWTRRHECEGRLPVHPRSGATCVSSLTPLRVVETPDSGCTHTLIDW